MFYQSFNTPENYGTSRLQNYKKLLTENWCIKNSKWYSETPAKTPAKSLKSLSQESQEASTKTSAKQARGTSQVNQHREPVKSSATEHGHFFLGRHELSSKLATFSRGDTSWAISLPKLLGSFWDLLITCDIYLQFLTTVYILLN